MPATQYIEVTPYIVWALKYIGTNAEELETFAPNAIRIEEGVVYFTQFGKEDILETNTWVVKSPTGDFSAMINRHFNILYDPYTP